MSRPLTYFVSDVHLGLQVGNPADREARFVAFLRGIDPGETSALYLLGDIWDFWYEYRDVVPKGYVRVFAALTELMDSGVQVYFFQGNHDIWSYAYFEELGMKRLVQPYAVRIGKRDFCLGHGDGLGPGMRGYKFMRALFYSRVAQRLFSTLHPWFAFRIARRWSAGRQKKHVTPYEWKGTSEPLYKFALQYNKTRKADYFIFGHFHTPVDMEVEGGSRLIVLGDWKKQSSYLYFDGKSLCSGHSRNME